MSMSTLPYDAGYNYQSPEGLYQDIGVGDGTTGNVNLINEFNLSEPQDRPKDDINNLWAHAIADATGPPPAGAAEGPPPDHLDKLFPSGDNFTNLNVHEARARTHRQIGRGNTPITREFTPQLGSTFTPTIATALGDETPTVQEHQLIPLRAKISDSMVQRTINKDTPGTGDNTTTLGIAIQSMLPSITDYKNMCFDVYVYYLSHRAEGYGAQDELEEENKDEVSCPGEIKTPDKSPDDSHESRSQRKRKKAKEKAKRRLQRMAQSATAPSPIGKTTTETGDATKAAPAKTPAGRGAQVVANPLWKLTRASKYITPEAIAYNCGEDQATDEQCRAWVARQTARALLESAGCTWDPALCAADARGPVEKAGDIIIALLARLQRREAFLTDEGQRFGPDAQKVAAWARQVLRNDITVCWGGAVAIAALYMTTKRYIDYYLRDNKTPEIRTWLAQQETKTPSEGSIVGCALSIIEYCADGAANITEMITGEGLTLESIRQTIGALHTQKKPRRMTCSKYMQQVHQQFAQIRQSAGRIRYANKYIENLTATGELELTLIAALTCLKDTAGCPTGSRIRAALENIAQKSYRLHPSERTIAGMLHRTTMAIQELRKIDTTTEMITLGRKASPTHMAALMYNEDSQRTDSSDEYDDAGDDTNTSSDTPSSLSSPETGDDKLDRILAAMTNITAAVSQNQGQGGESKKTEARPSQGRERMLERYKSIMQNGYVQHNDPNISSKCNYCGFRGHKAHMCARYAWDVYHKCPLAHAGDDYLAFQASKGRAATRPAPGTFERYPGNAEEVAAGTKTGPTNQHSTSSNNQLEALQKAMADMASMQRHQIERQDKHGEALSALNAIMVAAAEDREMGPDDDE